MRQGRAACAPAGDWLNRQREGGEEHMLAGEWDIGQGIGKGIVLCLQTGMNF